jgi:four helix bundle protein
MSSFEDLDVWRRAKRLAILVLQAMKESRNFALRDQMARSAISVPSNIAEGAERSGPKEFANFLSYAAGSCAELITQIQIAEEIGEFPPQIAQSAVNEAKQIGKMIYGLRKSIVANAN